MALVCQVKVVARKKCLWRQRLMNETFPGKKCNRGILHLTRKVESLLLLLLSFFAQILLGNYFWHRMTFNLSKIVSVFEINKKYLLQTFLTLTPYLRSYPIALILSTSLRYSSFKDLISLKILSANQND